MSRFIPHLVVVLIAVFASKTSAQTQVASRIGNTPPELEIGSFTVVKNTVERHYNDQAFALGQEGDRVFANEAIHARETSSASIKLDDETVLKVGPNSRVVLDKLIYDPDRGEQRLSLRFLSGLMRFTSGSMENKAYEITTPFGSLNIRGTAFTLFMEEALHLFLNEGAITLELLSGETQDLDGSGIGRRFLSVVDGSFSAFSDPDDALYDAMEAFGTTFETPDIQSKVASDYMTAFFNLVTLEACNSAIACLSDLKQHFRRLCDIGVLRTDARRSLVQIRTHVDGRDTAFTGKDEFAGQISREIRSVRAIISTFPAYYGATGACGEIPVHTFQITGMNARSSGGTSVENLTSFQPVRSPSGSSRKSGDGGNRTSNDTDTTGTVSNPGLVTSPGTITPIQPILVSPILITPQF